MFRLRPWRVVPLLVLSAALASACGGESEGRGPPVPGTAQSQATAAWPSSTAISVSPSPLATLATDNPGTGLPDGFEGATYPAAPDSTPPALGLVLPADDAPHRYFTEWWYYTGHLDDPGGKQYGFQFVVFQVRLQPHRPVYVAHFALTDPDRGFFYDQKLSILPQLPVSEGFLLAFEGWRMGGHDGLDTISASLPAGAIHLQLRAEKPPALHDEDGLLDLGPAGWTYYYSRTRMSVEGALTIDGEDIPVTGDAWFDHQWGDFQPLYGDGGWDWFSVQFEDNTELMAVQLNDPHGAVVGSFGTYVDADGETAALTGGDIELEALARWTSPATGITYPSRWRLKVSSLGLDLGVEPVRPDQELDVRATTRNIYWEGAARIIGTRSGSPIAGRGYVELTGYDRRAED